MTSVRTQKKKKLGTTFEDQLKGQMLKQKLLIDGTSIKLFSSYYNQSQRTVNGLEIRD